jgi:YegS/Rv2252/BmrU family lipid kinase
VTERSATEPAQRRALILANRRAGQGEVTLDAAVDTLRAHGFDCSRETPGDPEALREAVRHGRRDYDVVVIAGGDGTLNSALPALCGDGAPLGILPMGTANDLARTLRLPLDPVAAAEVIATGREVRIDVGRVNQRRFFNVAHVGVGARARQRLTPERKRRWRALSYPVALFHAWREHRPFRARLDVDGRRRWFMAVHIAIGNGRYSGGGVPVDGDARISDARLDVYCIRAAGPMALFRAGRAVWRGQPGPASVWRSSGRRLQLYTRRPRQITADGEDIAQTPALFEVEARAVPVIIADSGPEGTTDVP